MRPRPRRRNPRQRSRAAGFSLIEVLIASALLLAVAVGVLPLFTRSLTNNLEGNEATQMSNGAVDSLEDMAGERFNAESATWTGVATDMTTAWEFQVVESDEWKAAVDAGEEAQYSRRMVLRQFQLRSGGVLVPVAGSTPSGFVHLKEVRVQLRNHRLLRAAGAPNYEVPLRKAY
jgi:prepilin-type N-terminal cleavage/methylation domain-containing protein